MVKIGVYPDNAHSELRMQKFMQQQQRQKQRLPNYQTLLLHSKQNSILHRATCLISFNSRIIIINIEPAGSVPQSA